MPANIYDLRCEDYLYRPHNIASEHEFMNLVYSVGPDPKGLRHEEDNWSDRAGAVRGGVGLVGAVHARSGGSKARHDEKQEHPDTASIRRWPAHA